MVDFQSIRRYAPHSMTGSKKLAERFEARLHLLEMRTNLLDQENLPEETDANFASEQTKMKEKQFEVWCELVQCLDKKSLSSGKTAEPNGTQAWKLLQDVSKVVNVLVSIDF